MVFLQPLWLGPPWMVIGGSRSLRYSCLSLVVGSWDGQPPRKTSIYWDSIPAEDSDWSSRDRKGTASTGSIARKFCRMNEYTTLHWKRLSLCSTQRNHIGKFHFFFTSTTYQVFEDGSHSLFEFSVFQAKQFSLLLFLLCVLARTLFISFSAVISVSNHMLIRV